MEQESVVGRGRRLQRNHRPLPPQDWQVFLPLQCAHATGIFRSRLHLSQSRSMRPSWHLLHSTFNLPKHPLHELVQIEQGTLPRPSHIPQSFSFLPYFLYPFPLQESHSIILSFRKHFPQSSFPVPRHRVQSAFPGIPLHVPQTSEIFRA